jgi:uncharacterized membrane protein YidH (DUF202 family)
LKQATTGQPISGRGSDALIGAAENRPWKEERTMGRGTGSGLIGLGVVLAVVGAVMRYAIEAQPSGFDVVTAGGILLLVGVVSIVVGLLLVVMGSRRSTTEREQISATPHGEERVTEHEGWVGP